MPWKQNLTSSFYMPLSGDNFACKKLPLDSSVFSNWKKINDTLRAKNAIIDVSI